MSYQFLDAYSSVLTADSNVVGGAHQPIVQISSITGTIPVTFTGSPSISGAVTTAGGFSSVSGVGVFNTNHIGNGSVITVVSSASIAGTYVEDSAHVTGDRGLFTLGVRNETMSSITSADGDYSLKAVGPIGESIVSNAPINKWFFAQTSVMYGTSVQAVAPQGASVFTYITGIQIANDSGNYSRVKFTGGQGSVLAWTVAPANGGSNINFINPIKTGENSGFSVSISGISSVYLSAQGFTSKT